MLDNANSYYRPITDAYYNAVGEGLISLQELRARMGFIPDRETSYASQMGANPFSLRDYKYMGENLTSILPTLASKPGATTQESIENFIQQSQRQKPGSNRVLARTHTHPTQYNLTQDLSLDIEPLTKSPSVQDFINAASVYATPQNSNLRYNKNRIYTRENGKNVRYTYDVSDAVKQKMLDGGQLEAIKYAQIEKLSSIPTQYTALVKGYWDSMRGKGDTLQLTNQYLNELTLDKYRKMGYPIFREEF